MAADVVDDYRMVPEDFVKHLTATLMIVVVIVLLASILFSVPEAKPLTIRHYATTHPIGFEEVAIRALDGQGRIANYGPPYNHGTGNVESGIQQMVGILHPINAAQDFILKPLAMAARINPAIRAPLSAFVHASPSQQAFWERQFTIALAHAYHQNGRVILPPGQYGPLAPLMADTLHLGRSGLMSGALIRNPQVVTRFNNQNYLLFLQGAPLHDIAGPLQLKGTQWGIIHPAVKGYPGAWWMTIPTWIYQWPFVANSPANDAIALSLGLGVWLLLAITPWIPVWNQVPKWAGVYRLIWKRYYQEHQEPSDQTGDQGGARSVRSS